MENQQAVQLVGDERLTLLEHRYSLIILAIWNASFSNIPIRFGRTKVFGDGHFEGVLNGIRLRPIFRRGGGFEFQITYNGVTDWQAPTMKAMLNDYIKKIKHHLSFTKEEQRARLPKRSTKLKDIRVPRTQVCNSSLGTAHSLLIYFFFCPFYHIIHYYHTDLEVNIHGQWKKLGAFFPNDVRLLDRKTTKKSLERPDSVSPTLAWINMYRNGVTHSELYKQGQQIARLIREGDQMTADSRITTFTGSRGQKRKAPSPVSSSASLVDAALTLSSLPSTSSGKITDITPSLFLPSTSSGKITDITPSSFLPPTSTPTLTRQEQLALLNADIFAMLKQQAAIFSNKMTLKFHPDCSPVYIPPALI